MILLIHVTLESIFQPRNLEVIHDIYIRWFSFLVTLCARNWFKCKGTVMCKLPILMGLPFWGAAHCPMSCWFLCPWSSRPLQSDPPHSLVPHPLQLSSSLSITSYLDASWLPNWPLIPTAATSHQVDLERSKLLHSQRLYLSLSAKGKEPFVWFKAHFLF